MPTFTANTDIDENHFSTALGNYMEERVLKTKSIWGNKRVGKLICNDKCACSRHKCVRGGTCKKNILPTCPHVGKFYNLKRGDNPFRILIFGMEAAKVKKAESVAERTGSISGLTGKLNAHMKGTLSTLQLLFEKELDPKDTELEIDNKSVSIFKCFALSNAVLCTPPSCDSSAQATPKMKENCRTHFEETIKLLKPQIIITQGVSTAEAASKIFFGKETCNEIEKGESREVCNDKAIFLPLYHPAQRFLTKEEREKGKRGKRMLSKTC